MNIKTLMALDDAESKILLYIFYLSLYELPFDTKELLAIVKDQDKLMSALDTLMRKDVIDIQFDDEARIIILVYENVKYDLKVKDWNNSFFESFIINFLRNDKENLSFLSINIDLSQSQQDILALLLSVKGKFKKNKLNTIDPVNADCQKFVRNFYYDLNARLTVKVPVDEALIKKEANYLYKYIKDLNRLDIMPMLTEASKFFKEDKYYSAVVTNTYAFVKNLPKFEMKMRKEKQNVFSDKAREAIIDNML